MLGIIIQHDLDTDEIVYILVKNDCGFEYSSSYASIGILDAERPEKCIDKHIWSEVEVYKNCNDKEPMYKAIVRPDGVELCDQ